MQQERVPGGRGLSLTSPPQRWLCPCDGVQLGQLKRGKCQVHVSPHAAVAEWRILRDMSWGQWHQTSAAPGSCARTRLMVTGSALLHLCVPGSQSKACNFHHHHVPTRGTPDVCVQHIYWCPDIIKQGHEAHLLGLVSSAKTTMLLSCQPLTCLPCLSCLKS